MIVQKALILSEQGVISLSNFLLAIIVARYLSIAEFGIFTLIWIVFLLINTIQQSLINNPYMTLPESYIHSKRYKKELQTLEIFLLLVTATLFLIIFYLLTIFYQVNWSILLPSLLTLILFNLHDFLRRVLFANNEIKNALFLTIMAYLARTAFIFILFVYDFNINLVEIFWISVAFYAISISIAHNHIFVTPPTLNHNTLLFLQKHWKTGKWLLPSKSLQWSSVNIFILAAGSILSPAAVGILRSGQNLLNLFNIVLLAGENYFPRRAVAIQKNSNNKSVIYYLAKWSLALSIIILGMSPIINTFDDDILVTIYGLQYDGYGYILKYYIVLALISVFLTFIQVYLRVTHSLQNWLFAHTVATMIALIMSYPLISNYNIDGVLYGLILSQIVILTIIIARTTNTQIRVTYNA